MKHKYLAFNRNWDAHIGKLGNCFAALVYGKSGQGKTEYCLRLARQLEVHGSVAWISYEQGHGYDLQQAIARNGLDSKIIFVDPMQDRGAGTLIDDLIAYISGEGSADFIVIDSIDYLELNKPQYLVLKDKCVKAKKGVIFISHEKQNEPASYAGRWIAHDGQFSVRVKKYIAYMVKNRIGGIGEHVIWEEQARKLNPDYFDLKGVRNCDYLSGL